MQSTYHKWLQEMMKWWVPWLKWNDNNVNVGSENNNSVRVDNHDYVCMSMCVQCRLTCEHECVTIEYDTSEIILNENSSSLSHCKVHEKI